MVFRITNIMTSQLMLSNANNAMLKMYEAQKQVTTGKKFSSVSESPYAANQVLKLNTQIGQLADWKENIATAGEELKFGYDVLSGVQENVQRINELTIRLANAGNSSSVNLSLITEINERAKTLAGLANTQYQGTFIFGGTNTMNAPYLLDDNMNVTYEGTVETQEWQRKTEINYCGEEVTVNVLGKNIFGDDTDGIFATIKDLNDILATTPVDIMAINQLLNPIQDTITKVSDAMSIMSSSVNRLEMISNINTDLTTYLKTIRSDIHDVDIAEASTSYALAQASMEATLQIGAKMLNGPSLLHYL